jgi:hypothetical protein
MGYSAIFKISRNPVDKTGGMVYNEDRQDDTVATVYPADRDASGNSVLSERKYQHG